MLPNITISEHAAICLDLFSRAIISLAQNESLSAQTGLPEEFDRFKLWTSNIGVFADLHSSLDYRLRDFGDIKDSFSRQLATIESRLHQVYEANLQTLSEIAVKDDNESDISKSTKVTTIETFQDWDNAQLLQSIHQSIDWLHRLSNLVRKTSFANQHKRADTFKLKDEDGNDLSDILISYYSRLIRREFSSMQDILVKRLAESMLTRRRRIMYRRSQQQRWKIQQQTEPKSRSLELATPSVEPVPATSRSKLPRKNKRAAISKPDSTAKAPSHLTATTVDTKIRRHISAPSSISKGSSTPLNAQSKQLVPPPPKGVKLGEDFVCDYCCLILPSKIALNSNAWADHVNKDLYPYVCVVDDCDDPVEIYSSRKEWLAHIRTRHLMRWYCMAKPHTVPLEFASEGGFIEHMKIGHAGKFRDGQLSLVADSSSRPKDPVFDDCPFCVGVSDNLEEHVALHLRDLALRSLPWPDDDERYSQRGEYMHKDSSMSNKSSRGTIVEFMSEPLEFSFAENSDHEDESETNAGERLHLYGHFQKIADQHQPLDLREQLSDEILESLIMRKCKGNRRVAYLIKNLKAQLGDTEKTLQDLEEIFGLLEEDVDGTPPDPLGQKRPTAQEGAATAGSDEYSASVILQPPQAFEIVIICTLLIEYNAICLIFDEIWDKDYRRNNGDENTYTTGRIQKHDVVLALLPQTGRLTAAGALAHLQSIYSPSNLFFMVGICGGVPSFSYEGKEIEMMLGDIVIGNRVLEYELSSTDKFVCKSTLRTNSNNMRSIMDISSVLEHYRKILRWNTARFLAELQRTSRKTISNYRYPGTSMNWIFPPHYFHKHRAIDKDCEVCNSSPYIVCEDARETSCEENGCEWTFDVTRKSLADKQTERSQKPMIHYGTIASSGIAVKNGLERDNISDQESVMAFDMYGFGAWEKIPCIFIKGICNYADGHKDDTWQSFAAATAAAAAKAVLRSLPA